MNIENEFEKWLETKDNKFLNKRMTSTIFNLFVVDLLKNHYSDISLIISRAENFKKKESNATI